MYNGIGLTTPRGSGTSGHIVSNLSQPSNKKVDYRVEYDVAPLETVKYKMPNKEVMEHERKRKIESKCLEYDEKLEEEGVDEETRDKKVAKYRDILQKDKTLYQKVNGNLRQVKTIDSKVMSTKESRNLILKKALGIADDYVTGTGVKRIGTKESIEKDIKKLMNPDTTQYDREMEDRKRRLENPYESPRSPKTETCSRSKRTTKTRTPPRNVVKSPLQKRRVSNEDERRDRSPPPQRKSLSRSESSPEDSPRKRKISHRFGKINEKVERISSKHDMNERRHRSDRRRRNYSASESSNSPSPKRENCSRSKRKTKTRTPPRNVARSPLQIRRVRNGDERINHRRDRSPHVQRKSLSRSESSESSPVESPLERRSYHHSDKRFKNVERMHKRRHHSDRKKRNYSVSESSNSLSPKRENCSRSKRRTKTRTPPKNVVRSPLQKRRDRDRDGRINHRRGRSPPPQRKRLSRSESSESSSVNSPRERKVCHRSDKRYENVERISSKHVRDMDKRRHHPDKKRLNCSVSESSNSPSTKRDKRRRNR